MQRQLVGAELSFESFASRQQVNISTKVLVANLVTGFQDPSIGLVPSIDP